jgi:hypothetical protein
MSVAAVEAARSEGDLRADAEEKAQANKRAREEADEQAADEYLFSLSPGDLKTPCHKRTKVGGRARALAPVEGRLRVRVDASEEASRLNGGPEYQHLRDEQQKQQREALGARVSSQQPSEDMEKTPVAAAAVASSAAATAKAAGPGQSVVVVAAFKAPHKPGAPPVEVAQPRRPAKPRAPPFVPSARHDLDKKELDMSVLRPALIFDSSARSKARLSHEELSIYTVLIPKLDKIVSYLGWDAMLSTRYTHSHPLASKGSAFARVYAHFLAPMDRDAHQARRDAKLFNANEGSRKAYREALMFVPSSQYVCNFLCRLEKVLQTFVFAVARSATYASMCTFHRACCRSRARSIIVGIESDDDEPPTYLEKPGRCVLTDMAESGFVCGSCQEGHPFSDQGADLQVALWAYGCAVIALVDSDAGPDAPFIGPVGFARAIENSLCLTIPDPPRGRKCKVRHGLLHLLADTVKELTTKRVEVPFALCQPVPYALPSHAAVSLSGAQEAYVAGFIAGAVQASQTEGRSMVDASPSSSSQDEGEERQEDE